MPEKTMTIVGVRADGSEAYLQGGYKTQRGCLRSLSRFAHEIIENDNPRDFVCLAVRWEDGTPIEDGTPMKEDITRLLPSVETKMVNCAGCGLEIEALHIAGRIKMRPYCRTCLEPVVPKTSTDSGPLGDDGAGPWQENNVRELEDWGS